MNLSALRTALAEGYRVSMKSLPEGKGIVATILPRSFPGGPIPDEYRREFGWSEDLSQALETFADEAREFEEPDWEKLGYLNDDYQDEEDADGNVY